MIDSARPLGKGRAAYAFRIPVLPVLVSYQRPRVKKPRSARTRITMRMIQRMLTAHPSLPVVGAERFPPPRKQRPNSRTGYAKTM
jgi:hypothetical protein